jgi:hypothetical protein
MKIQWTKIPSVTTGGKPYFYRGDAIGSSIVWNRADKKYHATLWGKFLGWFDNIPSAKKAIQLKFNFLTNYQ